MSTMLHAHAAVQARMMRMVTATMRSRTMLPLSSSASASSSSSSAARSALSTLCKPRLSSSARAFSSSSSSTSSSATPDAESFLHEEDKWSGVLSLHNPPKLSSHHYALLAQLKSSSPSSADAPTSSSTPFTSQFAAEIARAYAPLSLRAEDVDLERLPGETPSAYRARQEEACRREIALEYSSPEARARRVAALANVQHIERQLSQVHAMHAVSSSDDVSAQVAHVFGASLQRDANEFRLLEDAWSRMPVDMKAAFETQSRRNVDVLAQADARAQAEAQSLAAAAQAAGLTPEQQRDLFETVEGDALNASFEVPEVNWAMRSPTDLAALSRGLSTAWSMSEVAEGASGSSSSASPQGLPHDQQNLAELFPPHAAAAAGGASVTGAAAADIDVDAIAHGTPTNLQDVGKRLRSERRRHLRCRFCNASHAEHQTEMALTYTNLDLLHQYINVRGMIYPRKLTGNCQRHQRRLREAVKRARYIGLLSYTSNWRVPPSWFLERAGSAGVSGVSGGSAPVDVEHEEADGYAEEDVEEEEEGEVEQQQSSPRA